MRAGRLERSGRRTPPRPAGVDESAPVSYGCDETGRSVYFRLAVDPDSDKGDVDGRPITFVTCGQEDGRWQSVVVEGGSRRPPRSRSRRRPWGCGADDVLNTRPLSDLLSFFEG